MISQPDKSSSGSKTIPTWDGTRDTYALFKVHYKVYCTMHKCSKIFNKTAMNGLLKEKAYEKLAASDPTKLTSGQKESLKLHHDNARMSAVFTLGQKTSTGAMVLAQTVTEEYVHGKVIEAFATLDREHQPRDVTSEVELEHALEKIPFGKANGYYTRFVEVMASFQFQVSENDKLKIMVKKCTSPTYAVEIRKQMIDPNGTFAKGFYPKKPKDPKKEEGVSLLGLGTEQDKKKGGGKKDCSHCGAKGHKRADCTKLNAALKKQEAGRLSGVWQGTSNMRKGGMSMVGHAGVAVNATHTVDIKCHFKPKNGTRTTPAGPADGVSIGDLEGVVIHFDIVVKTPRCAIFAAHFIAFTVNVADVC
eukprot:scaffold67126_cov73-Cyclotella_meneghiniana.AAC.1